MGEHPFGKCDQLGDTCNLTMTEKGAIALRDKISCRSDNYICDGQFCKCSDKFPECKHNNFSDLCMLCLTYQIIENIPYQQDCPKGFKKIHSVRQENNSNCYQGVFQRGKYYDVCMKVKN